MIRLFGRSMFFDVCSLLIALTSFLAVVNWRLEAGSRRPTSATWIVDHSKTIRIEEIWAICKQAEIIVIICAVLRITNKLAKEFLPTTRALLVCETEAK